MLATESVLVQWHDAVRRLGQTPAGTPEAAELQSLVDDLCREYNAILVITVDPPPPRVDSPPDRPPTPASH